jgi:hypothetical protein
MTLTALVFAVSGLAACGGGGSTDTGVASAGGASAPTASTSATTGADGLKFAACMRQNGIDMPDPDPSSTGGGGGLRALSGTIDQTKLNAALLKCQQYRPAGGASALADPANQKALQALASCMRGHGVDVPDPDPVKGFAGMIGQLQTLQSDPDWSSALTACQSLVPTQDAE